MPTLNGGKTDTPCDAAALAARFAPDRPSTLGIEEELMVLHPETYDLVPRAAALLEQVPPELPVKLEMPASQLEIFTPRRERLDELGADLRSARRGLSEALRGKARLFAAGTHPFAAAEGTLNRGERYERMERDYGTVARRQLVCGLHVHVAIGGPERALAVYNAARGHLPEVAALAANAPFHAGADTGMASIRPLISAQLPRQGIPPVYESWQQLASDLSWGGSAGRLDGFGGWWWEMRPHAVFGTLEVRVADAQTSPRDALAVAAFAAGLILWLAARHDAGDLPAPASAWRIGENRWSAARRGCRGELADLQTGKARATAEVLEERLDQIEPVAVTVGGGDAIRDARRLLECGGADHQRELAGHVGLRGLVQKLADEFL